MALSPTVPDVVGAMTVTGPPDVIDRAWHVLQTDHDDELVLLGVIA
jgi:hypothetical protein